MKKIAIVKEFLTIAFFVVIFIVFGTFIKSEYEVKNDNEFINLTENANLYLNGELVCMGDTNKYDVTDIKYGDELTIEVTLNNDRIKNPVISFNNNMNLGYKIKIDGKKYKSVKMKALENSVVCNNQVRIPLELNEAKGVVEITLRCTDKNVFTHIPNIICINCGDEMPNFILSNIEYIIIGFGLIELGLICILLMWVNMAFKIVNTKIVYVALSAVSAGIWILTCYQITGTVLKNLKVDFYLEYVALAATIAFMSMYVRELYDELIERKLLLGNAIAVSVIMLIISILQALNLVYMNDSVVGIQICFILPVVLIVRKYINIMKEKNVSLFVRIAEIIMIFSVLIYYLMSHFTSRGWDALNFVILAIIIVLLQAIKGIVIEMQTSYISSAEEKSIAKLAYIDTLTGLYNRRGLDRFIDDLISKKNGLSYKICSFDLNRLKKINDTYGHGAGDVLIKTFAQELREILLDEEGFVGRMGGDEFIAIIKNDDGEAIEKLKHVIKEKNNNGEFDYKIKYSVGTVDFINNGEKDIHDAIRMADYAMYEMKTSYVK